MGDALCRDRDMKRMGMDCLPENPWRGCSVGGNSTIADLPVRSPAAGDMFWREIPKTDKGDRSESDRLPLEVDGGRAHLDRSL